MKEQILQILKTAPEKFLSVDEILKKSSFFKGFEGKRVRETLNEMVNDGSVVMTGRGKFALGVNAGLIKGKIIGSTKGFAFLQQADVASQDFFIPERSLHGAVHGDTVLCKAINKKPFHGKFRRRFDDNPEAEVVKILERGYVHVVGLLSFRPMGSVVIPDDSRFTDEIFIGKTDLQNVRNVKVVVEILEYPSRTKMARGKIIEVLGDAGDLKVTTLSIVRAFNLIEQFPQIVEDEAKKVAVAITPKELKGRTDFRKDIVFTVDGEDARDFDDAVNLTKNKDGSWHLCVHIADVSHYVKHNSAIDLEAFRRATSVYFPDMVLPMLPVALSNDMCSLNEKVDRLTLSVVMDIDNKGNVIKYNICNGVINSCNRMTYTKVTKILEGDKELCKEYAHLVPMINDMAELTQILIKKHSSLGSVDFDLPESKFLLSDKYEVLDVGVKPRTLADRLIEQFMVITNEVVAKFSVENKLPFVYRVHESPTPEKIKAFNEFIKTFGINANLPSAGIKPMDVQKFLQSIDGMEFESVVNKVMLRSMQKAVYYEKCMGHFGLASKYYCHFTSPIRRYPDLTIHRILKEYIAGSLIGGKKKMFDEFVVNSALKSTEMEQLADDAERAVDDLKKAEFMSKHLGEEFVGVCSGVSEAGVFVALANTCEGLIPKDTLPKDVYVWERDRYRLVGKHNCFQLGDKIKIQMVTADLVMRRSNFALVEKLNITKSQLQSSTTSDITHKNRRRK